MSHSVASAEITYLARPILVGFYDPFHLLSHHGYVNNENVSTKARVLGPPPDTPDPPPPANCCKTCPDVRLSCKQQGRNKQATKLLNIKIRRSRSIVNHNTESKVDAGTGGTLMEASSIGSTSHNQQEKGVISGCSSWRQAEQTTPNSLAISDTALGASSPEVVIVFGTWAEGKLAIVSGSLIAGDMQPQYDKASDISLPHAA